MPRNGTSSAAKLRQRTGGQVLVDQLLVHGVEMAFCVPGESYLEVLDALHDAEDRIRLINARHEAGAANMAEAYGKLTGKPGIALVTRGPGACHAAIGVHTARQDSTPLILLIGQVGRDALDREAFQEIDYRKMFVDVAKWTAQIDRAERVPEYMARAFHVATSGRPGPVVLALPEDMLTESVTVADAVPAAPIQASPAPADMERMRDLLARAERPLILIGGGGISDDSAAALVRFAEANELPASCSFRRIDSFDNTHDCYVGDLGTSGPPALIRRAKDADLLLVFGARLGEMTTQGYTVLESPEPKQRLVHVHADAEEMGRVYRPTLAIQSGPNAFATALAALKPIANPKWKTWTRAARADYVATLAPSPYQGALDMGKAMAGLREFLPKHAIVTLDAGNHTGWPQRYLQFGRPMRLIGPTSGAMAYSVPAAVACSLVHPDRLTLGFVGDGGFMMSGLEIATSIQHGGRPILMLSNNRSYGTIRMHQEREHPQRVVGTDLVNPDFAAMGRAMGCHAESVEKTEEFAPALDRAVRSRKPAIVELKTDPERVSTRTDVAELRAAAKARKK